MNQKESRAKFLPARPTSSLLWLVQHLSKMDLNWRNRVIVSENDLQAFAQVPKGDGIILTPNHADEMDPRICFEVSRRANRCFVFMCNREAFSEMYGLAGLGLQRIGAFSVERGGHDSAAKRYATDVLLEAKNTLVIFPEGEIFYLNESLQPFHSGAIEIGMQAILEKRKQHANWSAHLLPMSIKYRYRDPLNEILEAKIKKMEAHLAKGMTGFTIESRLEGLMEEVVRLKESQLNLSPDEEHFAQLAVRLKSIRHTLLKEVGAKYKDAYSAQARTIDQSFQLAAKVREKLALTQSAEHIEAYEEDLSKLKEVGHLVSLSPGYMEADPSPERIAELVIKLERELYGIKRPVQLGKRDVYVKIGSPVSLGDSLEEYAVQPHVVRHKVAEQLRSTIQTFINESR